MKPFFHTLLLAIILSSSLCLSIASAQNKPNLSGTWKMNPSKSKLSSPDDHDLLTIKFEHKGATLKEAFTVLSEGHEHTFELEYTIDGQKHEQEIDDVDGQTMAQWDGDALVLRWEIEGDIVQRKITLSTDGKVLTMNVRYTRQTSETNETVVFDKQ